MCAGLYLGRAGKYAEAVKYFAEAGILADPLIAECEARAKSREEVLAKQELMRLLAQ